MSALGAAHLAGTAVGIWAGQEELAGLSRPVREFRPDLPEAERRRRRDAWSEAVERSRGHAVPRHEFQESVR
jgi:glycerol kinase